MRVSQLIHAMDKDDDIVIHDADKRANCMQIYKGTVRGLKKDDPINKMHVHHFFACDNVIMVLVGKKKENRYET